MTDELDFDDLVDAWLDYRRSSHSHPDLAGWSESRYAAMAKAFGADLDHPPDPPPVPPAWLASRLESLHDPHPLGALRGGRWARHLHVFALRTEQKCRALGTPFSGFLEIDATLQAVRSEFAPPIDHAIRDANAHWRGMLVAIFAALHPDAADTTVNNDALK